MKNLLNVCVVILAVQLMACTASSPKKEPVVYTQAPTLYGSVRTSIDYSKNKQTSSDSDTKKVKVGVSNY